MSDPFHIEESAISGAGGAFWLEGLNPPQRAAVEALDGPVLVLAGAGTGKTRVLTTRLAHLLHLGRARPHEVLAVTFTNKAAREMSDRAARLLDGPGAADARGPGGGRAAPVWLGTFHAMGARILRRHAELAGLAGDFTILDTDDQVRLLRSVLEAADIDEKRWPARGLASVIQRWKDRALTPDRVTDADAGDLAGGAMRRVYRDYQARLGELNAADFGDLLLHNLTIFAEHPDVLAGYQDRFRHILVDEYQDTNVAQYLWLRLLAQRHRNIACVGDDDQSIYAWRGAEVGNILRFETDFPGAGIVRLEQNYRSTGPILGAAAGLIARNKGRLGKTLWTDAHGGERVRVCGVPDGEAEVGVVSGRIEHLRREGRGDGLPVPLGEIAVLVRTGAQTRAFEERFLALGLPYRVVGGPRFYERREIRDALAYLRVISQPADDLAFERIVNRPRRGIGDVSMQMLRAAARDGATSLYGVAGDAAVTERMPARTRRPLEGLMADFERWRARARGGPGDPPLGELTAAVLEESGYLAMVRNDPAPDAPGRLESLGELVSALEGFDSLAGFLEHVSLVMENTEAAGTDLVNIMTLHSAKGLEFDVVFLPGWEEGLFPHPKNMLENGLPGLEEERRLAYVGLTRARHEATILYAANRFLHGRWQSSLPSRFVEELPREHVDVSSFASNGGFAAAAGRPGAGRKSRALALGERVFHEKFGYGRVAALDAAAGASGEVVEVEFEKAGRQKVFSGFVVPAGSA